MGSSLFLKKAFGQLSSRETQRPDTLKPVKIVLTDQEKISSGQHTIEFKKGDILIQQSGMYLIIMGPQFSKLSGDQPRWIDFWLRVNNVDVPNSNVRAVIKDPAEKDVIMLQVLTHLSKGDFLNSMMSVEALGEGIGIEAIKPEGEPLVPSIILTIVQM